MPGKSLGVVGFVVVVVVDVIVGGAVSKLGSL